MSTRFVFGAAPVALLALSWVAVAFGSREGALVFDSGWIALLFDSSPRDELLRSIVLYGRLPRVLAAWVVGAALASGGIVLQAITRNPLADPYLLGISGGAGLAVVLLQSVAAALGALLPWYAIPFAALVGAALATLGVLRLAGGGVGRISVLGLILGGVVINALCAALMSFLLARFDPFKLRVTSHWLYGGFGYISWLQLACVALLVLATWIALRASAHRINAFALGLGGAAAVGVDAPRLLLRSALAASLLAALGVSMAGLLGYVGLVVPHAVRLLLGLDLRRSLAASALGGATLLVVADAFARLWLAPEELPVGVVTALLGCPVLLALLRGQLGAKR